MDIIYFAIPRLLSGRNRTPPQIFNDVGVDIEGTRKQSVNKLIEALSIQAITASDVEMRFKTLAVGDDAAQALAILDRLDSN